MPPSIATLRAKSKSLKEKRKIVLEKLFALEVDLVAAFEEMKIFGSSKDVTLEQIGEDDCIYGHLSFSTDSLNVAFRDTHDDYYDAMHGISAEGRSYALKHISLCSAEWLEEITVEKVFTSLITGLEAKLDEMNSTVDHSLLTLSKIWESQAAQLSSDTENVIRDLGAEELMKDWAAAHSLIALQPADSITRSSSYLESVCKKILSDLLIPLPNNEDITSLIGACVKALGLSEDAQANEDIRQLVGGIKGIFKGVGTLRTHFGTAHGSSPGDYKVNEHYARLVNNAAATVSIFLLRRLESKSNHAS